MFEAHSRVFLRHVAAIQDEPLLVFSHERSEECFFVGLSLESAETVSRILYWYKNKEAMTHKTVHHLCGMFLEKSDNNILAVRLVQGDDGDSICTEMSVVYGWKHQSILAPIRDSISLALVTKAPILVADDLFDDLDHYYLISSPEDLESSQQLSFSREKGLPDGNLSGDVILREAGWDK